MLVSRSSLDDERQIARSKIILSRFKGIKMIEDVDGTFDDYSISSKIRQIFCCIEAMD